MRINRKPTKTSRAFLKINRKPINENSCKSKPCIPKDYSWYAKKIETSQPIVGETSVLYKAPPTGSLPLPESLI